MHYGFVFTKEALAGEPGVEVVQCQRAQLAEAIRSADAAVPLMTGLDEGLLRSADRLKLVIQYGVGVEAIDIPTVSGGAPGLCAAGCCRVLQQRLPLFKRCAVPHGTAQPRCIPSRGPTRPLPCLPCELLCRPASWACGCPTFPRMAQATPSPAQSARLHALQRELLLPPAATAAVQLRALPKCSFLHCGFTCSTMHLLHPLRAGTPFI